MSGGATEGEPPSIGVQALLEPESPECGTVCLPMDNRPTNGWAGFWLHGLQEIPAARPLETRPLVRSNGACF